MVLEGLRRHGVDPDRGARREGPDHVLVGLVVPARDPAPGPVQPNGPEEPVHGQADLADHLGQAPGRKPEHQVELEETLGRDDVSLGEPQVVEVSGVDVRHAPPVPDHLHRFLEAVQPDLALQGRQGLPSPFPKGVGPLAHSGMMPPHILLRRKG